MKEKLKRLKAQLAEASGAQRVEINVVDMDFLLTVAIAADVNPKAALEQFEKAMGRASRQNEVQRAGLDRLIRRMDTAKTYLASMTEDGLSRENLIKLTTAKKALAGEFDQ